MKEHIESIFYTSQLPPLHALKPQLQEPKKVHLRGKTSVELTGNSMDINTLRSFYHIHSEHGNNLTSQAVFESVGEFYSPNDLIAFQNRYKLPLQPVTKTIPSNRANPNKCSSNRNDCAESSLDLQYIMAVAPRVPTTYWYADDDSDENFGDSLVQWIVDVSSADSPPLVHSLSYGYFEDLLSASQISQFNLEALKLSAQGVTIVASSGDDGAPSALVRVYGSSYCGYHPVFPASSPYVLSVGGTQGPETGAREVSCASNTGGSITTGGGFSLFNKRPSYQSATVDAYLQTLPASKKPVPGYKSGNRAYPDVAMAAHNYPVIIAGSSMLISGTSASAPVVAAFISLVNAQRLAGGKPAVGFINPAIYSNAGRFTNDIKEGSNKCAGENTSTCE